MSGADETTPKVEAQSPDDVAGAAGESARGPVPGPPAGPGPTNGSPDHARDASVDLGDRVGEAEESPLAERADAYRLLHDELAARLEATPGTP